MSGRRQAFDGQRFAANIQAQVYLSIDSGIAEKARTVNSELSRFVNQKIDAMFIEGIKMEGLTAQKNSAPPSLMRNTSTTWEALSPSTVERKKATSSTPDTIYRDKGDLERALSGAPAKSVSSVFGGYSNKSAKMGQPTFIPARRSDITQNLRPNRAGGKPPDFTRVLSFSVFHALKSRAVPETIMDILYPSGEATKMSMKLGYYAGKNSPVRYQRSLVVPYADFFVRVKLPEHIRKWVRGKK